MSLELRSVDGGNERLTTHDLLGLIAHLGDDRINLCRRGFNVQPINQADLVGQLLGRTALAIAIRVLSGIHFSQLIVPLGGGRVDLLIDQGQL